MTTIYPEIGKYFLKKRKKPLQEQCRKLTKGESNALETFAGVTIVDKRLIPLGRRCTQTRNRSAGSQLQDKRSQLRFRLDKHDKFSGLKQEINFAKKMQKMCANRWLIVSQNVGKMSGRLDAVGLRCARNWLIPLKQSIALCTNSENQKSIQWSGFWQ